ncbi:MAG: HAD family phosphatase [Candidatus Aenigmarchaeota archaeon]|nr:HAD family phosphatase [Candidatus Aenigmarchaeota archaeon]
MIKAVIFDHGGVLSVSGSLKEFGNVYAPKFGVKPDVFNTMMLEIWMEARVGRKDSKLFWTELARLLGITPQRLKRDFIRHSGFRRDVFEIARDLKKAGYKLGILSNQIEDWFETEREKRRLDRVFDAIVTSYGSGMVKPDAAIYREAVRRLGVKPGECIFVDDAEKNMPPARKMGMKTILFKNAQQLKKELKALGAKL